MIPLSDAMEGIDNIPHPEAVVEAAVKARKLPRRATDKAMMSDAGRGVRYRWLKIKHGTPEPTPDEQKRYLRGEDVEKWYLDELDKLVGFKGERQHHVPSPFPAILGKGHVDFYVKDLRIGLEVKSAQGLKQANVPYEANLLQCGAYANFDPEIDLVLLDYVDPSTYEVKRFPIQCNEKLREELLSDLAALQEFVVADDLPDPCFGVEDGDKEPCITFYGRRKSLCPFHETCWAGTEALPSTTVGWPSEDFATKAKRLVQIKEEESWAKNKTSELKKEKQELQAELAPIVEEAGGLITADGVSVKLTEYERTSFDYKSAILAGVVDADLVSEYVSLSVNERWTVKAVGE